MYFKNNDTSEKKLYSILQRLPDAVAVINGSSQYSHINGTVKFYGARRGVLVVADINGLPVSDRICKSNIFAFHIHNGSSCTGNETDPFAYAGTHYNPNDCVHPYHAGDMPSLFAVDGQAFLAFFTNRFNVNEIIGKTVVIHDSLDDFTSQPSGNAGNKIACGAISRVRR